MEIKVTRSMPTVNTIIVFCYILGICFCEVVADTGSVADFSAVVNSKLFVDKTLLIQDFLRNLEGRPEVKIITAPTRFGKSTVIDMLKRFLSIPVNNNGNRIPVKATENYRIFCRPKLKICENKTFVRQHMGQYPVIHMDYRLLEQIRNVRTLIEQLQLVILNTFTEHKYLQNNRSLWVDDDEKNFFPRYFHPQLSRKLTKRVVSRSFNYLAKLLYTRFGKKVIILIDEYDASWSALLFGNVDYKKNVCSYLSKVSKPLFRYNNYLGKALMTGVLRVKKVGVTPDCIRTQDYQWLGDHEYSKYYGLTEEEVSTLITKYTDDETEINKIKNKIDYFYKGYRVLNQNTTIYSLWSVLNFLQNGHSFKADSYWEKTTCFKYIMYRAVRNERVRSEIMALVTKGHKLAASMSSPLDGNDISQINILLKKAKVTDSRRLYVLLFDLGFLTTSGEGREDLANLEIPNLEMQIEFSSLLTPYIVNHYERNCFPTVDQVVSSLTLNYSNGNIYKPFVESLRYVIGTSVS